MPYSLEFYLPIYISIHLSYHNSFKRVVDLLNAGIGNILILLFQLDVPVLLVSRHSSPPRFDINAEDPVALIRNREKLDVKNQRKPTTLLVQFQVKNWSRSWTCEDDNVDVILGALKLIGDSQVAVNIFLSQPCHFPRNISERTTKTCNSWEKQTK